MSYAAVLDADVLHPQITVDLLLRLAERRLFRPLWSRDILDEVLRSLMGRGFPEAAITRRIAMMEEAFPEAMVDWDTHFLNSVPSAVDPADRHVVAAALAGRADAIVTRNLRHFPADALHSVGLEVQDLDAFLLNQWTLDQQAVEDSLTEMESDRMRPPRAVSALLDALERQAPFFATAVRRTMS